ncbi:Nonspecific lipid-transfer protein, putative [Ricinus communis]|uniref:Nonspecific lipid-transfer protein, putative n=2 Tax=Ricinus communis TaxID=3988 RepID=B9SM06_RICCO|nr:Nonspecific lipid-transfer protein, putative [Ricinus communis]
MSYVTPFFMLVLLLGETVQVTSAVTCDPVELSACANAITSSSPPSAICCSKLKQQRPCLCQYVKNPNLQKLVNSPNAKKVATICGSPFPNC